MMDAYYLDSSALVKRYHREVGTEIVDDIIEGGAEIYISSITLIEIISTLKRKVKSRKISNSKYKLLKGAFLYDVENRFTLIPLDDSIVSDALRIAEKYGSKSLDSLHLAFANKVKAFQDIIFVSADIKLLKYASKEGFKILNPEKQ